jgi:hypothetical protein
MEVIDKKFDRIIKAIKEVGFPIVAFLIILTVGINWADRLLTSQEKFVEKVGESVESQDKNTGEIKVGVERILHSQERSAEYEEEQTQLLRELFKKK